MSYTFDKKTGHIIDADGIAIAYSHVPEWGQEIVTALNSAADIQARLAAYEAFTNGLIKFDFTDGQNMYECVWDNKDGCYIRFCNFDGGDDVGKFRTALEAFAALTKTAPLAAVEEEK